MRSEFTVRGFHCKACKMLVEDIAQDFPQITSCKVNAQTGKVVVEYKEGFDVKKFKKEIEDAGDYTVL